MADVQDGGVVGLTKKSLGLGTADQPLTLDVPPVLLITREAQPTEVWEDALWRHGVGVQGIAATAAERQSIALINPASSGTALRVHRFVIGNTGTTGNFEVREGPITQFVSTASTDWADFGKAGDPAGVTDGLSSAGGVVTGSQVRENYVILTNTNFAVVTPYIVHPQQALIVNPTGDNRAFQVSFWFEQFRSSSQF